MRRFAALAFFLAGLAASFAAADPGAEPQQRRSPRDLSPQFRTWLEEDVPYIITPTERDVFLQLESDRERNIFIEAFWKQRDPNPSTAENEFKDEHYRRITYANQNFGRESPGPGWRTDQGRVYITIGEPKQIEKFENLTEIYPVVIWFYEGMAEYGLPNAFYVAFYKKNSMPPYVLYSPVRDGPQSLLIHYQGDMTSYESAFYQLMQIEPGVAEISLSLIPGETHTSLTPSVSSEILLGSKIPAAPRTKVKDDYAEKLLRYKDIIEVDYSTNYIGGEGLVRVYQQGGGPAFVHYLIEPSRLTFEETSGRFLSEIEVNGHVSDESGRTIYQFERSSPIEMTREQIQSVQARLFSYQDVFPLIPGRYKLSVLWKNRVSREFTSLEADLVVPGPNEFAMSQPVLAPRIDRNSTYRGRNKSFLLGGLQLTPTPRNDFLASDTLYHFVQLRNLPAEVRADGAVTYAFLREGQTVLERRRSLREIADPGAVLEEFPLASLPPAYYTVKTAVVDGAGAERVAAESSFFITPRPVLPRPWVMSLPQPASTDPVFANVIGSQYLNAGQTARAKPLLEDAWRRSPGTPAYALDYARALAQAKDYAGVLAAIAPFLGGEQRYDFLEIAGEAHLARSEWAPALECFKDYLSHFGANLNVLNAAGECSLQLGDKAEALSAWEKSLSLNPDQPALRERVKALKEK